MFLAQKHFFLDIVTSQKINFHNCLNNSRVGENFLKQALGISRIIFLSLLILAIVLSLSFAESIQYFYDDVGRLIATVSDTGDVTIYTYDEVGNLLFP